MDSANNNFRSAAFNDSNTYGGDQYLHTPFAGNVRALAPPPLPQPPTQSSIYNNYYPNMGGMYGNMSYGGYGGYGGGGFGGYGGMYNRFGGYGGGGNINPLDPEYRFIQLAESNTRPAFQSIESLVAAVANIASMLDSTFYALTSSFRAILGVAANFGRLRGVFTQFWQTFILFRGLNWLYRKILHWLHISKYDTSKQALTKTIADGLNNGPPLPPKGNSPWPVLAFLSFIFTAPYLVMKLLGTVTQTAQEESRNPAKWVRPIETVALYDFQARNESELTLCAGQVVTVAPKEIQNTQMLLNTGWALATVDGCKSGLIPLNYVKSPKNMRESPPTNSYKHSNEPQNLSTAHEVSFNAPPNMSSPSEPNRATNNDTATKPEIDLSVLNVSAFAPPPPITMRKSVENSANILNANEVTTTTTNDSL